MDQWKTYILCCMIEDIKWQYTEELGTGYHCKREEELSFSDCDYFLWD